MYEIEPKSMVFSGGKRCRFAGDIAEIVVFDEALVVRLVDEPMTVLRNVFGVNYQGSILWQIPRPVSFTLLRPYVSVTMNCGRINALSWDGHVLTLHPGSGIILYENYCTDESGFHARRSAQPRRWL